jgi:hypothetical protein
LLIACVKKEVGSGIRCFFTPRIRDPDPGWSNGRIRIRDKTSRIRNTAVYLPRILGTSFASGAFLPPGSGMNFFRTWDPEGMFFGEIFFNYLKNPCSFIFLLIRLVPETTRSKKKVGFNFHPFFYVQYSSIRDENFRDPE